MSVFYFSWADPPTTAGSVPPFTASVDEDVVSFNLTQTEGECAQLSLDVRNPRIGLLNPGRQVWAWFGYDGGSGPTGQFYGRLVGVPSNIIAEVVTLLFIAKPVDFVAQKYELALNTLMVLPAYDPVWVDPDKRPAINTAGEGTGDVDVVLEGYSARWHVNRTTLVVSISDIIAAEDGLEVFTADDVPYDSVSVSIGEPPLTSVNMIGHVNWSQSANGIIDFGERWFDTFTGGSIISSWPQKGGGLSGGWSVVDSFAIDVNNVSGKTTVQKQLNWENREKKHTVGDVMSQNQSWTEFPVGGHMFISNLQRQAGVVPAAAVIAYDSQGSAFDPYGAIDSQGGDEKAIPLHMSYNQTLVAGWLVHTKLVLQYDAGDNRLETARFRMVPDLQAIVTLPDPTEVTETIELTGTDVGVDIDGAPPLGDTSRNQYFTTDRGRQSFEYLMRVARAHILGRARPVSITFDCKIDRAFDCTLRKDAQIQDPRLPGGVANGKITSYTITGDGDGAELKGAVTISCAIGHDGTISPVASSGFFVDAGFSDTGMFAETGGTTTVGTDMGYTMPDVIPTGLIYPLTKAEVTVADRIDTFITDPIQVGSDTINSGPGRGQTTKTFATFVGQAYYLELKPVTGNEFNTDINVEVTELRVPKMIDLEAASV